MSAKHTEAAVLVETGRPLCIERLEIPSLKPGQLLVDIAYSGVCGSQLLEVRGERGPDRFLPHVLGHEGAGIIAAIGPGVTKVKPGDHVVLSWIKGSGADVPSTVYRAGDRTVNSGAICTLMRTTVTCESRVTPIAAEMPLREAALLGCAVPTGMGMLERIGGIKPGASVAVFGAGGVGLSAVLAASRLGADPVIAVDVSHTKLELASRVGATHLVDALREDPIAAVLKITGGCGVDCAIESAGRIATMEAAFAVTRAGGGLCVVAGNVPVGERMRLDPMDLIKGKKIVGAWGGGVTPDVDIPKYVERYLAGDLPLEALIACELPLDCVNDAIAMFAEGVAGRALIRMAESP